jgi:hypothetical protein
VQLEKMPSNSGQQTKFTQDGYVLGCNKRIEHALTKRAPWAKVRWSIHTDDQYVLDKLWAISRLNMKNHNKLKADGSYVCMNVRRLGILDFTELGTKVWVMTGGVHGFVQT